MNATKFDIAFWSCLVISLCATKWWMQVFFIVLAFVILFLDHRLEKLREQANQETVDQSTAQR